MTKDKLAIFISGTMRELAEERRQVAAAIRAMGHESVWAEGHGATNRPSRDECERMVRECDVYLGLYGLSYGWKFPPDETLSVTEFEWQIATATGKPLLIYKQRGEPCPEQADFLSRVGDWQQGRFFYTFETLSDLVPRLRDDLSRLVAESFRPRLTDEQLEARVISCLEGMGYEVKKDCSFQGVRVPILAEYSSGLLVPQQVVVGFSPRHIDDLVLAVGRRIPYVVYIAVDDVPERIGQQQETIHILPLETLSILSGLGRAEAELRHAVLEWSTSGVMRLLSPDEFRWISGYRRELRERLDPVELAYALRCSLQHGINLPFWSRANSENARAIEAILQPIIESHGRRPLLRAGYALERLTIHLRKVATAQAEEACTTDEMRKGVIQSAAEGKTTDFWQSELRDNADYRGFLDQLLREVNEPED